MPTYEYSCSSCGNRYEKREGFDAPARQKCPKCRKTAQRVLSLPGVVFKGSGFYKTDSRGSSGDSSEATTTPAPTATASDGHAHSHGPGGHTHDSSPVSTSTDTSTESAAAG